MAMFKMTEQKELEWHKEYAADMEACVMQEEELERKDERVLRKQKRRLSKRLLDELDFLFYVYENGYNYEIVKTHMGCKEEVYEIRRHYFNDGECSKDITGEYSGSGTIWFPIGNGNYFKFDYYG